MGQWDDSRVDTVQQIAAIKKAKGRVIQLKDKHDLRAELRVWLNLSSIAQEGPWCKARHHDVSITTASSDVSSNQYGGEVSLPSRPFSAGGGLPHEWLSRHIHGREMFALLEVLKECCNARPGELQRAQAVMDGDNTAVVNAFRKGRSSKHHHTLDVGPS